MSVNLDQPIRKQSIPIVAWILLIAFAGLYLANLKLNPQCREAEQNSQSSWGITENSINAKLLWQKVNIPGLRIYGVANSNLAVSEKYVLIARDNVCYVGDSVTAFEVDSGETAWTSPFSLVHFLRAYDDAFYIIYGDIQVARTLASGKQSRLLTKLPPRSARILYPTDHNVFLPVGADTFAISQVTSNTEIIEHEVIIGADNGITVYRNGDNELRLEDNDKKRNLPLLRLSEVNPLSLNSPGVYVDRINNILVVKYGAERTHRVDGFSIETGNLIWTINKIFNSVPILLNNTIVSFDMDNRLELYNIETGALIGSARFTATTTENGDTTGLSVWLAGNGDVVSILMQNTKDLLTVRISDIPTLE